MELSCKLGRPSRGMGSIDSPTHTQEDCVDSDISTLKGKERKGLHTCTCLRGHLQAKLAEAIYQHLAVVCTAHCVVAVRLLAGHQA
eukprot:1160700-Pelagomonas_calceolata.AAC.3